MYVAVTPASIVTSDEGDTVANRRFRRIRVPDDETHGIGAETADVERLKRHSLRRVERFIYELKRAGGLLEQVDGPVTCPAHRPGRL